MCTHNIYFEYKLKRNQKFLNENFLFCSYKISVYYMDMFSMAFNGIKGTNKDLQKFKTSGKRSRGLTCSHSNCF